MKKLKRNLLLFLCTLCLVICAAFGFAACGGGSSAGNGTGGGNTEQGGNTQKPDDGTGGNTQKPDDKIVLESVSIKNALSLEVGESSSLTVTYYPKGATSKTNIWDSLNDGVAVVDNGTVTAVAEGTATITVTCDFGLTAYCLVTVTDSGQGGNGKPDKPKVEELHLNENYVTLYASSETYDTVTLTASVFPAVEGAEDRVEWEFSSYDALDIDTLFSPTITVKAMPRYVLNSDRIITATASVDGVSASCEIAVRIIESLNLIYDGGEYEVGLETGETLNVTAEARPADIADKYKLEWSSSDERVATVSENGTVTAVGYGRTTIRAEIGDVEEEFYVLVEEVPAEVESITLNKTSLTLTMGESETLIATVNPANAADKGVHWATTDSDVAYVDENGKVYGGRISGTATVTATSRMNGVYATCTVTVNPPVEALSVTLDNTSITLEVGENKTLTATVLPENAFDKSVSWKSSDATIVTVENGKLTAIKAGDAEITVKTVNDKTAVCTVKVINAKIPVESVSLDKAQLTLFADEEDTLTATVLPADATDKTVSWKSSDEAVAAVDQNGRVVAVAAGQAVITVKAENNETASCTVTVNNRQLGFTAIEEGGVVVAYAVSGIGSIIDNDIVIPSEYMGKPVTTIAWRAIMGNGIESVTVPSSVTVIKGDAFWNLSWGFKIKYLGSLNGWCNITFEGSFFSYGTYDLYVEGQLITELIIPEGLNEINDYAFMNCKSITDAVISTGVTSIGNYVFKGCYNLTGLTVSSTLASIGNSAFVNTAINRIAIENLYSWCKLDVGSISEIQYDMYLGGEILTDITIPSGITEVRSSCFHSCKSIAKVTISSGVTSIGSYAFYNCQSLEKITIPDSVSSIGNYAFYGCRLITELAIPSGVTSIGKSIIEGTSKLKNLSIPFVGESPDGTGINCFGYIFGASNINEQGSKIPKSLKSLTVNGGIIKGNAFYDCTALTSVVLCSGVSKIERFALQGCKNLESITLPFVGESPTSTNNAFSYIFTDNSSSIPSKLKTVRVTDKSLGVSAFANCTNITDVILDDGVFISGYAFSGCTSLKKVNIPYGATAIASYVFRGCTSLTSLEIPETVDTIGAYAFTGSGLINLVLSENVTLVGEGAFENCTGLKKVYFSKSLTSLPKGVLKGCTGLEFLSVPFIGKARSTSTSDSYIGWLFGAESSAVQGDSMPATLKTVAVTDGGEKIWQGAFQYCSNITAVMLSKTILTINNNSFTSSGVNTVYYEGTAAEWKNVTKNDSRMTTYTTLICYYSAVSTSGGWHYDTDGITPVKW